MLPHITQAKKVAEEAGKVKIDANLKLEHDTEEETEKGKLYLVVVDQAEEDEEQLVQRMLAEVKPLVEDSRSEAKAALLQMAKEKDTSKSLTSHDGDDDDALVTPPQKKASAASSPPGDLTPPPGRRPRKGGGKGSAPTAKATNILDPKKNKGDMEPDTQTYTLMILSRMKLLLLTHTFGQSNTQDSFRHRLSCNS